MQSNTGLNPAATTPDAQSIQTEGLRHAYAALPLSIIASCVNAVILAIVMASQASFVALGAWLGVLLLIMAIRGIDYTWFHRRQLSVNIHQISTHFDILAISTAVCWGVAGQIFFTTESAMHFGFLAFILAGISAGAVTSLAVRIRTAQWYVVICLLPFASKLFMQQDPVYLAMCGMVLLFMGFCLSNARRSGNNINENIRLRLQSIANQVMLQQQDALLKKTGQLGKIGGWYYDTEKDSFYCTPQVFSICHLPEDVVLTTESVSLLLKKPYRDFLAKQLRAAITDGKSFDFDAELELEQNQPVWLRIAGSPYTNPRSTQQSIIGIIQDITDRKAIELAKSAFLANMSHEIRTPMHGIIGMLQLIDTNNFTHQQQQQLTIAKDSANHLLGIINDILDYSKLGSAKLTIQQRHFVLHDTLTAVTHLLAPLATNKGISLITKMHNEPTRGPLIGDPERLQQILTNLVGNAIKFTEQGSVTLQYEIISRSPEAERIRFEIIDNGIGISAEAQARLFVPFEQADISTTRKYGGTGLGLSICKQLVELMHGQIGVSSTEGIGSTFWFEIPFKLDGHDASREAMQQPTASSRSDVAVITGKQILLVEDNPVNQMVATEMLRKYGCFVEVAENGQLACEVLQSRCFDLVMMDIQMPVMDGLEATQRIRQYETAMGVTPSIIVALTANAFEEDRQKYMAAGMNDYLSKPFSEEQLVQLLLTWLTTASTNSSVTCINPVKHNQCI